MDVRTRRVRVTFFYLALIGLLIVVTSFYTYNLINKQLAVGSSPAHSILNLLPFYERERIPGVRVAILRSRHTADFLASLADSGANGSDPRETYFGIAQFWQTYLDSRQLEAEIIEDDDLLSGLDGFNLLILPAAYCLSQEQMDAVKTFLSQERGVILTHLSGNRDADGSERRWSLTSDITGGEPRYIPRVSKPGEGRTLYVGGENPLAANLPPGFPMEVRTYDEPVTLKLRDPRSRVAATWRAGEGIAGDQPQENAGIVYGNYLGGRFVWLGFSEQSVPAVEETWVFFDRLLGNAIDWTVFRAVAGKMTWPKTRAAATFSIIAHRDLPRAQELQGLFLEEGVRPAFLIGNREVPINRVTLERLGQGAEIAASTTASVAAIKDGFPPELIQQLEQARDDFREHLHQEVTGFNLPHAPRSDYERISRLGYDYIWLDSEFRSVPKMAPVVRRPLFGRIHRPVLIFQGGRGDRLLIEEEGVIEPERLLQLLLEDFEHTLQLGGLYSVTLHSHLIGREIYADAVRQWLKEINRKEVWAASPREIAEWWRLYENVVFRLVESPQRLTLMISNEGREPVPEIRLVIYPHRLPSSIDIRAERINTPIPAYQIDRENNRIELRIEEIGRRENRTYFLDM